jgi:hypothetical protein
MDDNKAGILPYRVFPLPLGEGQGEGKKDWNFRSLSETIFEEGEA